MPQFLNFIKNKILSSFNFILKYLHLIIIFLPLINHHDNNIFNILMTG